MDAYCYYYYSNITYNVCIYLAYFWYAFLLDLQTNGRGAWNQMNRVTNYTNLLVNFTL